MNTIDRGITYEVKNLENDDTQTIQFIHKVLNEDTGVYELYTDGTTNEELLSVLIDRMLFLQEKLPCKENRLVIALLESAMNVLNQRTKDRKGRCVINTPYP